MKMEYSSDYGSGSSINSSTNWVNQQIWPSLNSQPQPSQRDSLKSSSFMDLMTGKCTLDDVMQEFKMNGSDSPYNPDEDTWKARPEELAGLGAGSAYLRQKSWPAPEKSPSQPLPRYTGNWAINTPVATSTPVNEAAAQVCAGSADVLTAEQCRVLSSLPDAVLHALLRRLQQNRPRGNEQECRFCKNNGERESYYRSHALRDAAGRARCPVLRALVCARCGAAGDTAHTLKYCPLTSHEERIKSTAMMRSVRMASGRRRLRNMAPYVASAEQYMVNKAPSILSAGNCWSFNAAPPVAPERNTYNVFEQPLDPMWAALEKKLML